MRLAELLRLVWMNINQNKFKSVMTSIGIVVGAATIVLVIGIGQGGQQEVAEQFAELNAGAIDVTYEYEDEESGGTSGFSFGSIGQFFGGLFGGGGDGTNSGGMEMRGGMSSGGGMEMGGGASSGGGMEMGGGMSSGGSMEMGGGMSSDGEARMGRDMSRGDDSQMEEGMSRGDSQMEEGMNPDGLSQDAGEDGDSDLEENGGMNSAQENGGGTSEENAEEEGDGDGSSEEEDEEETSAIEDRLNQEQVILSQEDVEDIERYVTGISGATISYSTRASVEGGELQSAQTYTVAGVKESFLEVSKLELAEGEFLTEEDDESKSRVCVLGATAARELYGSASAALGNRIYIDDRTYSVVGVLSSSQTVASGISPDTAILVPYETGIKYITGTQIDPVLTVIAEDVNVLADVIEDVETVLEENYVNARFTFEDSGSKMQAAQSSNQTLTLLLSAMAAIVFLVGGIGIMNVLFVSVKERTNEIGILKAIGTSRGNILTEFLIEAAAISLIGGILGVAISFGLIPLVEWLDVRIEVSVSACLAALGFAVLTGTVFGIYPAWKAARLEPVEALNAE